MQKSFRYLRNQFFLNEKAIRRPNGRKLRRLERGLEKLVKGNLDEQKKYVLSQSKKLFEKNIDDDLDNIFDNMDDSSMIENIIKEAKKSALIGGVYRQITSNTEDVGVVFSMNMDPIVQYFDSDRPLILSKMKQTTKEQIAPILRQAVLSGDSYNTTAKIISESFAFSLDRAQMISVNEIGHAYEEANKAVLLEVKNKGFTVVKRWLTVNDDKVTPQCEDYQSLGWINIDREFISGDYRDDIAPRDSNPRCRCTIEWDFD